MKTLFVAAAFLLATAMGAHADSGSGAQVSADFSGAVGDSVAKGTAIAAVSVGAPVALVGMSAYQAGSSMMAAGSATVFERAMKRPALKVADRTIVTGRTAADASPANASPDRALKARLQEEEL